MSKVKAFPLYMDTSGCDYHRVSLPFQHGEEHYDHEVLKGFEPAKLFEYLAACDVAVYNRHFPLGLQRLIEVRKNHGTKLIVDLDDWVELPVYHPLYKRFKNGDAKTILENIRHADCVTVTTDRLYQKIKEFNKNVHVIPNALPFGHGQFQPGKEEKSNDLFNCIYAGQSSHLEDIRLIQPDVVRIKSIPNIAFTLAGYSPKSFRTWNQMENVVKFIKPYTRIEAKGLREYMTVYDQASCSLVPLCINEFNSCKSNLKLLEAGAKKIPAIVSHVSPYRDDHDAPVLWVKEKGDWYKHIKTLAANPSMAEDLGQQLHEYVNAKYNLFEVNKTRFELYKSVGG